MRRLPWPAENGGPAYLSSDPGSVLTLVADDCEERMLENAEDVLRMTDAVLSYDTVDSATFAIKRLRECLRDAADVARMRGERLAVPVATD